MKNLLLIIPLLLAGNLLAQNPSIAPQVINSAGSHRQVGTSNVYITDNVGEPFTETLYGTNGATLMLTQGFLQPFVTTSYSTSIAKSPATCEDKNDGVISLAISPADTVVTSKKYIWSPASVCPSQTCATVNGLKPGTYSVMVIVTKTLNTLGATKVDTLRPAPMIIDASNVPCKITIFTGFTPGNDGVNDIWKIQDIETFAKNHVTIFNRWGIIVADISGYDNKTKVWPTQDQVNALIPSTYFYVIDLGDGTKPYKGWVEVIKN